MLPNPLPDNPIRWEGWRLFNSNNLYERLCLDFDTSPTTEQIENNCRQLLVWWQKKLPLKNQPSNPMAQMLRAGLEEAPHYLADARTKLLDPEMRSAHDAELRVQVVEDAITEFKKVLRYVVANNQMTAEGEERLYSAGIEFGLSRDEMKGVLDAEIERLGVMRVATAPPAAPAPAPALQERENASQDPADEFRRMLRLSKLCLDGDEMTDDQRDTFCNMGESLGLTGGQAEDLIDEYLEGASAMAMQPSRTATVIARPAPMIAAPVVVKAKADPLLPAREMAPPPQVIINTSPIARIKERERHPNFTNSAGIEMRFVPSGVFFMGSNARDAAPHEQPASQTTLSGFYIARFPVTNGQYELCEPTHRSKRSTWANENHPVVYISSHDAIDFCHWLSVKERRKYRLPTEAEWEYAARGTDGRPYPWGPSLDAGHFANFADRRTAFAWRDVAIDDGFAETAPVGSYPRGASPFQIEDMAGNVFEWCLDFFGPYRGRATVNPRGPSTGAKRIYRGGSWKSRAGSLRTTARAFNAADFSANDVGFRILCECE